MSYCSQHTNERRNGSLWLMVEEFPEHMTRHNDHDAWPEGTAAGVWGSWPHWIQPGNRWMLVLALSSPFDSVQDSSPWDNAMHIQNRSFHLNLLGNIVTGMSDGVSPRGFCIQSSWQWAQTIIDLNEKHWWWWSGYLSNRVRAQGAVGMTDSKAEKPGYHRISLNQKDPHAWHGTDSGGQNWVYTRAALGWGIYAKTNGIHDYLMNNTWAQIII